MERAAYVLSLPTSKRTYTFDGPVRRLPYTTTVISFDYETYVKNPKYNYAIMSSDNMIDSCDELDDMPSDVKPVKTVKAVKAVKTVTKKPPTKQKNEPENQGPANKRKK